MEDYLNFSSFNPMLDLNNFSNLYSELSLNKDSPFDKDSLDGNKSILFSNKEFYDQDVQNGINFLDSKEIKEICNNSNISCKKLLFKIHTKNNKSLKSLIKVDNNNKYKCPFCDKKYTRIRAVYRHIERGHNHTDGFPCKDCGKLVKDFYKHKKYCKNNKNKNTHNQEIKNNTIELVEKNKNNNLMKKGDTLDIQIDFNTNLYETYIKVGNFFYWKELFVGSGATINTYIAADKNLSNIYAIKIQTKKLKYNYCKVEFDILSNLIEYDFFPKVFEQGNIGVNHYLIETLVGPSLENIIEYLGTGLDIVTVSNIGIKLLNLLESLHNKGIPHCDLKPSNIGFGSFLNGKFINDNQIILLDYSYSTKYIFEKTQIDEKGNPVEIGKFHYLPNKFTKLSGTYSFMSDEILNGKCPSRKSELENFLYVLIYLFKGKLPWSDLYISSKENKRNKILNIRNTLKIEELFQGMPNEFIFMFKSIKTLNFLSKPNYELFRTKLKQVILANKGTINTDFCFKNKIKQDITIVKKNEKKRNIQAKLKKLFKGFPIFI